MQVVHDRVCFEGFHGLAQLDNNVVLFVEFGSQLKTKRLMPPNIRLHPLIHSINPIHLELSLRRHIILPSNRLQHLFQQLIQLFFHPLCQLIRQIHYLLINISRLVHYLVKLGNLLLLAVHSRHDQVPVVNDLLVDLVLDRQNTVMVLGSHHQVVTDLQHVYL